MSNYPDDISGGGICHMEGHASVPRCSRCGYMNMAYLGYLSGVARRERRRATPSESTEGQHEPC